MASVETKLTNEDLKKVKSIKDLPPEERARQLRFAEKLRAMAGKVHLEIDLDELRGR